MDFESPNFKRIKLFNPHKLIVRIFCGGINSYQEEALIPALDEFKVKDLITVENLYVHEVKKYKMTIKDLIDWLLFSNVHLLICHIHQGIVDYLQWNMDEVIFEIKRLSNHDGYPTKEQVSDPVLLQDKMRYIEAVKELTDETLKIMILVLYSLRTLSYTVVVLFVNLNTTTYLF